LQSSMLHPSRQAPFANEKVMTPSIIPLASMRPIVRAAPPSITSPTAHLPLMPVSFASTTVPTVFCSTGIGSGIGATRSPTGLNNVTFGAPPLVNQSHRLMIEKEMLQEEIMRDRQIIVKRQERLAQLESEQQKLILQEARAVQERELQHFMMNRRMIREKIREDMRIQEALDGQMIRREVEMRTMMQQSMQGGQLLGPVRHSWDMRQSLMTPLAPPQHHVFQNQSYGLAFKQKIFREQAPEIKRTEKKKHQTPDNRENEDGDFSESDEETEDGSSDIII
jgi:hypothetical protein